MIQLSASSLTDFLKCSKMYQFRTEFPHETMETVEMLEGKVVHAVLQDLPVCDVAWTDWLDVTERVDKLVGQYNTSELNTDKILIHLHTAYTKYPALQAFYSTEDKVEYYFNLPFDNIQIVGRMDRIVANTNSILDYKTGTTKKYINNNIQYILYYWAYRKLFGRYPMVYQLSLAKGTLETFYPEQKYIDTLFNELIPSVVEQIKSRNFYREGYYTGACFRCNFIGLCNRTDQE